MAVHVNISDINFRSDEKENSLHLLPCTIKTNGDANVSKYFEPNIKKDSDETFSTSLRGYPLHGKEVSVPDGYRGYILLEANERLSEETSRSIYVSGSFRKFKYWNYDKTPCANDRVLKALNWTRLATALHSPTSLTDS